MNFIDMIWHRSEDDNLREVGGQIDQVQSNLKGLDVQTLAAENIELKLRIGLLVRLLVNKGLITAQEYAALIAEARPKTESGPAWLWPPQ